MKLNGRYVNQSFAEQNLAGVELSGQFVDVDFRGTNLAGARLSGTFVDASFDGADLTGADLSDAKFVSSSSSSEDYSSPSLFQWVASLFR